MSEEPYVSGDQTSGAAAQSATEHSEPIYSDGQVPLEALQAERAARQEEKAGRQKLQDDVDMMRNHLALIQANQNQPKAQTRDDFEGMSDDDVLTLKDIKKVFGKKEKEFQMTIQEMKMSQKYPDYQEVVTQYLPEILKQNPVLGNTLAQSQDYELAYYLAKNSDSYKTNHKSAKKNADAERIVQNANKAGSLSSVGQTSPISEAKRYKTMSDDEFKKTAQKNLGYY